MTDQEMNLAIAEACGWRFEESIAIRPDGWRMHSYINNPKGEFTPNYTTDLNAMHESAMWLKQNDKHMYGCYCSLVFETFPYFIDATARQRAEAFLRTVGRWTE